MADREKVPRHSFNPLNGTRFSMGSTVVILLLVNVGLTGMMFSFHLGVWDLQAQELSEVKKQGITQEKLLDAMKNTTYQAKLDTEARSKQASMERQFQINLTKSLMEDIRPLVNDTNTLIKGRTALIQEIRNNTQDVLDTLKSRQYEHENQTDILIRGLAKTGNGTAQAQAIKNVEKILKNQQEILSLLRPGNITK